MTTARHLVLATGLALTASATLRGPTTPAARRARAARPPALPPALRAASTLRRRGPPVPPPSRAGRRTSTAPYSTVRWDEDYGYLKDPARRTDFLDPIKYIPIDDQPDWYLSLGGQVRDRYEYFHHVNFDARPAGP